MKLSTLTAFLATAAISSMASPINHEERDNASEMEACKEAAPGKENVQVYQTQHRKHKSSVTDVGIGSLFSYQRPASGSKYGTLTISNAEHGRKVIEFWSGRTRVSYEIYGRQDCTVRLSASTIDHYRYWKVKSPH